MSDRKALAVAAVCERIDLPVRQAARVDRMHLAPRDPAPLPFPHFHDAAELVLYSGVTGEFFSGSETAAIGPGTALFVPGMHFHDFRMDPGHGSWTIIRFDPFLIDELLDELPPGAALRPWIVQASGADQRRLAALESWLLQIVAHDSADPLVCRIVGLLLALIFRLPGRGFAKAGTEPTNVSRFMPAITRLRAHPAAPPTLVEAARLCSLSPAHFSRRFAATFGTGFLDYAMTYRLHVAGRRIVTTSEPLSQIGYTLGFRSPSHFSARFRRRYGISPRAFRQGQR